MNFFFSQDPALFGLRRQQVQQGPLRSISGMSGKNNLCRTVFTVIQEILKIFSHGIFLHILFLCIYKQACLIHPVLMTFKPAASAGLSSVPRLSSGITERNIKDLKCITVYLLWEVQTLYLFC